MSHPLIFTERRILPRLLDTLFTLIAWVGFGWLISQGLINASRARPDAGASHLGLDVGTIGMYLLVALFNAMLLILWARYNQHRFSVERRRRRGALPEEVLAQLSGVPAERVKQLQGTRSMVVSHDADGAIIEVGARESTFDFRRVPTLEAIK